MVTLGTVTGQEIKSNRGSMKVRMLQVELGTDAQSDIQSIEYFPLSGDDNPPQTDDKVVVISIGDAFKIAIGVRDAIETAMNSGERKLYSRDSGGAVAAYVNLLTGGDIELNGNSDTAVKFQALQDKLTALKTQLASHVHPGVMSGSSSTAASATVFDIDISAAESDTVKLK